MVAVVNRNVGGLLVIEWKIKGMKGKRIFLHWWKVSIQYAFSPRKYELRMELSVVGCFCSCKRKRKPKCRATERRLATEAPIYSYFTGTIL